MKKFLVVFFLFFTVALFYAHPPSDVTVNYDQTSMLLTINVKHAIKESKNTDPMKHFVKEIAVTVNGSPVITEAISFQQSDDHEISSYLLNVKSGDKVSVKASCSLAGSKVTDIVIK